MAACVQVLPLTCSAHPLSLSPPPRPLRSGHVGVVYAAVFTPEGNGRRVITGGHDRAVCVWEAASGVCFHRLERVHLSWVLGLDVRVDGLQFVTAAGDRTVGVWRSLPTSTLQQAAACLVDSSRRLFARAFGGGTLAGGAPAAASDAGGGGRAAKVLPVPLRVGGGVL